MKGHPWTNSSAFSLKFVHGRVLRTNYTTFSTCFVREGGLRTNYTTFYTCFVRERVLRTNYTTFYTCFVREGVSRTNYTTFSTNFVRTRTVLHLRARCGERRRGLTGQSTQSAGFLHQRQPSAIPAPIHLNIFSV